MVRNRIFMRAFIAGIWFFLLAFSLLSPTARPPVAHRNFVAIQSSHPIVNRAISKLDSVSRSPYLTAKIVHYERLVKEVLKNPRLIIEVSDEINREKQHERDSFLSGFRKLDPSRPMIALTFDDGPRRSTEKVYASLKKHDVVATFFVIGMYVNGKKDMLKKLTDAGNEIGNHSWSHLNLKEISYEQVVAQIKWTDAAIERATGIRPNFVRPPMGLFDNKVRRAIGDRQIAMWSIDTLDWQHKNWNMTMAAVRGKVRDGDIILIHDLIDSTANNLDELIEYLLDEGFQLVTMSELVMYRDASQKVVRYVRP